MPGIRKFFKRHRSATGVDSKDVEKIRQQQNGTDVPPVPTLPSRTAPWQSEANLHRALSSPALKDSTFNASEPLPVLPSLGPIQSPPPIIIPSGPTKNLPPTPHSATPAGGVMTGQNLEVWRGLDNREANISKVEKFANKIGDGFTGAVEGSSTAQGIVQTVIANETVRAVGKSILEGVPALMQTLDSLSSMHPFLQAAYIPFKLIYKTELTRRENDQKRTELFEKIKDFMIALQELEGVRPDDPRKVDGKPIISRLEGICKSMNKDITECYNVINVQEKKGLAMKFLKASYWNGQLAGFVVRFEKRKIELTFALQMKTATTVDGMDARLKEMQETMMMMFAKIQTPDEQRMALWIERAGGEAKVMASDQKILEMHAYQDTLSASSSSGTSNNTDTADLRAKVRNKANAGEDVIKEMKKLYKEDVGMAIQENLKTFERTFSLQLSDLQKGLTEKITHEGDRIIEAMKGGPHNRIKDRMIYHIWKEQGWRGSAETRRLVLALRDYVIERKHRSSEITNQVKPTTDGAPASAVPRSPASTIATNPPDVRKVAEEDEDAEMAKALPDDWMTDFLQVKRLRYIQQAVDPDSSGFTTITEVNNFTRSRPQHWSVPLWIAYWSIGWQIFATKYCTEIEYIFGQMSSLREQIGIRMPGNKSFVNSYLTDVWQHVTTLTTSLEKYDSPPLWLEEKFSGYVKGLEEEMEKRLEGIKYDIDEVETVTLLVGEQVEQSVFQLLALVLRRHLAKFHVCLTEELSDDELTDDADTILRIVSACWGRYQDLRDLFQHQQVPDLKQIFDWLSCGLFSKYHEWGDLIKPEYFMSDSWTAWQNDQAVDPVTQEKLQCILNYDAEAVKTGVAEVPSRPSTPKRTLSTASEVMSHEQDVSPDDAALFADLDGMWYGWHCTERYSPSHVMFNLRLKARRQDSNTVVLEGGTMELAGDFSPFNGTIALPSSAQEGHEALINGTRQVYSYLAYQYVATYFVGENLIVGGYQLDGWDEMLYSGWFLLKKVDDPHVMCFRPLGPIDTKARWRYACDTVLESVRRSRFSKTYVLKRLKLARQAIGLISKVTTTDEEDDEIAQIRKAMTFEEYRALYRLGLWYKRVGDLQPSDYGCDGCGEEIIRCRVVCLDCRSTDYVLRTVDFCGKPGCLLTSQIDGRTDVTHLPSHLLLKTRDVFLVQDYHDYKTRAKECLEDAKRSYIEELVDQDCADDGIAAQVPVEDLLPSLVNGVSKTPSESSPSMPSPKSDGAHDVVETQDSFIPPPSSQSAGTAKDTEDVQSPAGPPLPPKISQCVVCSKRVVAPCWYCISCAFSQHPECWVCDECEAVIDGLSPWALQARYRQEVTKVQGSDGDGEPEKKKARKDLDDEGVEHPANERIGKEKHDAEDADKDQSAHEGTRVEEEVQVPAVETQPIFSQSNKDTEEDDSSDQPRHNVYHLLVRFTNSPSGMTSASLPDVNLPSSPGFAQSPLRLSQLEERLDGLVTKFEGRQQHVDDRLGSIERLLQLLLAQQGIKISSENDASGGSAKGESAGDGINAHQ